MNLLKTLKRTTANNGRFPTDNSTLAPLEISVAELVGDGLFAMDTHGEVAYDLIFKALKQNRSVKISYKNVEHVTAGFITEAVGELYKKFKAKKIEELVELVDATELDADLFEIRINIHKRYLKNPRKYRRAAEIALNGGC